MKNAISCWITFLKDLEQSWILLELVEGVRSYNLTPALMIQILHAEHRLRTVPTAVERMLLEKLYLDALSNNNKEL